MVRALQPAGLYGTSFTGGRGKYDVGPNQPFTTIQEAVDALIVDQGPEAFSASQDIIIHEGQYAPFRIESDALRPTEDFRLSIRAAFGSRPVISGRVSPDMSGVGCLIGNNVPYVGLDGLFFRELIKGVVFGANSHDGWVSRTMFLECHNVAVWFYQADECVLDNSALINCGHGVVFTKTREANILHTTFYNDGRASALNGDKPTYCIYVDLQDDRGQGVEDTGIITMKNNIIVSETDWGLGMYQKDIKNLDSDYNCWYCPEGDTFSAKGGVAEIRMPSATGDWRLPIYSLGWTSPGFQLGLTYGSTWNMVTNQDWHSISDDPLFLKPSSDEESAKIDLDIFANSPVINKGTLSYTTPAYIGSALHLDFNRTQREPRPDSNGNLEIAIGAFAKTMKRLLTDTVFPSGDNPADEEDGSLDEFTEGDCADDVTAVDSAAQVYASAIPAWYPEVHRGQFYVRDQGYHLFKNKRGICIQDTQRTSFSTVWPFIEDDLQVIVGGKDVTDLTPWEVDGFTFTLWHHGIGEFDESSDVIVTAKTRFWDSDTLSFVTKSITQRWKLDEGYVQYFLPSNPSSGQPVVVTDDLLAPGNTIGLAQEFHTKYHSDDDETEILFGGPRNLWANSDFSYRDSAASSKRTLETSPFEFGVTGYLPKDHEIEATGFVAAVPRGRISAGQDWSPARGFYSMLLGPADSGYIAQRIKVNPEKPYTLSFYASLLETGYLTGDIGCSLEFYDQDFGLLSSTETFVGKVPGGPGTETEWHRLGLSFYDVPDTTINRAPFSDDAQDLGGVAMPSDTRWVIVKVNPSSQYYVGLDAFQVEEGYRPTLYTRIPKGCDLTVEYEENDARFYVVNDFTIQPVRNPNARGFLSIVPVSAHHWDPDALPFTTTLSDYKWAWGRINVLPWARTDGFNKYIRTPHFSTHERMQVSEKVSTTPRVAYPSDVIPNPTTVIARQGTAGESLNIEVTDKDGNPYMFEWVKLSVLDTMLQFPGYLAERRWGEWAQLGQEITIQLDEGGQKSVRFIPPEPDDTEYRGPKPSLSTETGLTGSKFGYVDLPYRVYVTNHGNPALRDENDARIPLVETGLSVNIDGTPIGGYTTFTMPHYPEPGTVKLFASTTGEVPGTKFQESFTTPLRERHYQVDYELGKVTVQGRWPFGFRIDYDRKLAWRNPTYPRRLYLDETALDQTTGNIILKYDAALDLRIEALPPTGMPGTQGIQMRIDAVAQHGDRSLPWQ